MMQIAMDIPSKKTVMTMTHNQHTLEMMQIVMEQRPQRLTTMTPMYDHNRINASESFTQGTNQTDIVLAVDTSCSMYDDIYNMSLTFSTFVDFLLTTKISKSLLLLMIRCVNGNVTHIDQTFSTSDAVSAFQDMLTYTQWASNAERPFMLMEAFLNEAVDSSGTPLPSGCNYGAIRPGARLALLGVADEPDQSIEPYTHYISEFQALKSNPDDVTFYSLGPLCYYNGYTHMENAALDTTIIYAFAIGCKRISSSYVLD